MKKKETTKTPKTKKIKGLRIGIGYDIHRLAEGRPFVLGGITIAHTKGLLGHSDGDALLHAACDAVLGGMGKGEIGLYYPPTDFSLMGLDSKIIAKHTMRLLEEEGGRIENMDIVIITESPKLITHYPAMKKSLTELFKTENINVKAKTHEGLAEIGKGEALECHIAVLLKFD